MAKEIRCCLRSGSKSTPIATPSLTLTLSYSDKVMLNVKTGRTVGSKRRVRVEVRVKARVRTGRTVGSKCSSARASMGRSTTPSWGLGLGLALVGGITSYDFTLHFL